MDAVWIIEAGEDHEGGLIIGVFANREDAVEAFSAECPQPLPSRTAGSLYGHSGCDWWKLSSYEVR